MNRLKYYYDSHRLPPERVESILQLGAEFTGRRRWRRAAFGMAALALALLAIVIWPGSGRDDLTERVMVEIARNHSKQLRPEFPTENYQELQARLTQIQFSILPSGDFFARQYRLQGGRYCSIQSELAAQLNLVETGTGDPCTLYITSLTPALAKVRADTRVLDGVRVQVWREEGRLFGLARDAAGTHRN